MFLYDEEGRVAGHLSPRVLTAAEAAQAEEFQKFLENRYPGERAKPKQKEEPLELRFGRLKEPEAQARLEWLCEGVRQRGGEQAAENMYRLMIARSKGEDEFQKEFNQLFPEKESEG